MARKAANGWKRRFDDPIPLPRGRHLITLEDAGNYVTRLPKAEHEAQEWQAAMESLILVAASGGPMMFARIGVMRALNRHVERVSILIAKTIIGASGNLRGTNDRFAWSSQQTTSGKCSNHWNYEPHRGVESPLPADAPKAPWPEENLPAGWRPQRYALGPFGARWIVEWPCTSAASLPRQRSWRYGSRASAASHS